MSEQGTEARAFLHVRTVVNGLRWLFIALLVLVLAVLVRLYIAPVSIDFLKPVLPDSLVLGDESMKLEFDGGALSWGLAEESLDDDWSILQLNLTGLRVLDPAGRELIAFPEGRVRLSGTAMLSGRLAPAELEVEGLRVALDWQGGDLIGTLGQIGADDMSASSPAALVLELLAPSDRTETAGYLQRINVNRAEIIVEESLTDSQWILANADLTVSRGADSMFLSGSGSLTRKGEALTRLDIAGLYSPRSRATHVELLFEDFNPSDIAGDSEAFTPLRHVNMPLAGSLGATFNDQRVVTQVTYDLVGGGGMVSIPGFYDDPVRLDRLAVNGRYDLAREQAEFDDFQLEFVGATVGGDGLVYWTDDKMGMRFHADIRDVPFQWLKHYWPQGVSIGAYEWVSRNLTAGHATDGELHVNITPEMQNGDGLPEDAFDFTFDFVDATAHYLRPMPPIVEGRGSARLTPHSFVLTADGGRIADVTLAPSRIRFDAIHLRGGTTATVNAVLIGNIDDVLTVIDHEPLGYPGQYGLDPRSVGGDATADLTLTFPLVRDLTLGDVDFELRSLLDPVRLPDLFGDVSVTDGTVTLAVNRDGIAGEGRVALNDVPFQFRWREDFDAGDGLPTRFVLEGVLSGDDWAVLSLPFDDYMEGSGELDLVLDGRGASIEEGRGRIDFQDAALGFEEIGWTKARGDPAAASFRFVNRPGGGLELPEILYEDDAMRAAGSMTFSPEGGGVEQMVIHSLRVGETHLAATVTRASNDDVRDYMIGITAESFDARPFITKTLKGTGTEGHYTMPAFTLDVHASRVLGLNNTELQNLQVDARYENNRWASSKVMGTLSGGGALLFELITPESAVAPERDTPTEQRRFSLISEDAGEIARALDLFQNAVGGALEFKGMLSDPDSEQETSGTVRVDRFRVVTAPTLSEILNVGAMGGVRDLLSGDGIGFERLDVPFVFSDSVITLQDARAWGPAIGLTMSGTLDIKENRANLQGSVVPAYTANSIIGRIPVLGGLLVGGEGQGLFAINYGVSGSLDDPSISVNPLSVLTPGFLRGLFGAFDGGGGDAEPGGEAESGDEN